jgi:hypothetical protein
MVNESIEIDFGGTESRLTLDHVWPTIIACTMILKQALARSKVQKVERRAG